MENDTLESEASSPATRKRRWPFVAAGLLLVAIIGVGAWQMVDMHHQISDLQTTDHRQQAQITSEQTQIASQRSQLGALNAVALGSATSSSLSGLESRISGVVLTLGQRIDCVNQALNNATDSIAQANMLPIVTLVHVFC